MNRPTKPTPDNLPRLDRGGCWLDTDPAGVRASVRYGYAPSYWDYDLGFRCVLPVRQTR